MRKISIDRQPVRERQQLGVADVHQRVATSEPGRQQHSGDDEGGRALATLG